MQLIEVYSWANDPAKNADLKKQLAAAIATAAVNVLAEEERTYNHDGRVEWAQGVLATPESPARMADKMIWGVLGNVAIQNALEATGTVTDGDLQFTVNSLVDTYAVD